MTTLPDDGASSSDASPSQLSAQDLFERADWRALKSYSPEKCAQETDKARAALCAACAHHHLGDHLAARQLVHKALEWGQAPDVVARFLISAIHQTLGRAAAIAQDENLSAKHFLAANKLAGLPNRTISAQNMIIRELTSLGLLTDAASSMKRSIEEVSATASIHKQKAELDILKTELAVLQHELSIALKRGQIMRAPQDAPQTDALQQQSVSQLGQDIWALERADFKRGGYFVEFGATDGVALSNSYLLEKSYGWNGLLAEPNPKFLESLKQNRSCTVTGDCIGSTTGDDVEFILADVYGGISAYADHDQHSESRRAYREAGNVIRLKTISLHDFLKKYDAPNLIDYISVDTEGSEFDILKEFPFDLWDVRCWTIEHNHTPSRQQIYDLMTSNGYTRIEAQWDDWYYR